MPPEVISALIAAVVSLVVAATSGIYVLIQSNKKIRLLRLELIESKKTERIISTAADFRDQYRSFEKEAVALSLKNPHDSTALIQHFIDFYSSCAEKFYFENQTFLKSQKLESLRGRVTAVANSGVINEKDNPSRMVALDALYRGIKDFLKHLNEEALKF